MRFTKALNLSPQPARHHHTQDEKYLEQQNSITASLRRALDIYIFSVWLCLLSRHSNSRSIKAEPATRVVLALEVAQSVLALLLVAVLPARGLVAASVVDVSVLLAASAAAMQNVTQLVADSSGLLIEGRAPRVYWIRGAVKRWSLRHAKAVEAELTLSHDVWESIAAVIGLGDGKTECLE